MNVELKKALKKVKTLEKENSKLQKKNLMMNNVFLKI